MLIVRLLPIYLNPSSRAHEDDTKRFRGICRRLGLPSGMPAIARETARCGFQRGPGGRRRAIVMVPTDAAVIVSAGGKVLSVSADGGRINLSAADVLEQARIKGCGLRMVEGR